MCCVKKSKIGLTFEKISRRKNIDRVILETSGISSPEIVTQLLINDFSIIRKFELKKIITVLDPIKALENIKEWDETKQGIYLANDLVISKNDLASKEEINSLKEELKKLNFENKIFYSKDYVAKNLLTKKERGNFNFINSKMPDPQKSNFVLDGLDGTTEGMYNRFRLERASDKSMPFG